MFRKGKLWVYNPVEVLIHQLKLQEIRMRLTTHPRFLHQIEWENLARRPSSPGLCSIAPKLSAAWPSLVSCHHTSAASSNVSVRWVPATCKWTHLSAQANIILFIDNFQKIAWGPSGKFRWTGCVLFETSNSGAAHVQFCHKCSKSEQSPAQFTIKS